MPDKERPDTAVPTKVVKMTPASVDKPGARKVQGSVTEGELAVAEVGGCPERGGAHEATEHGGTPRARRARRGPRRPRSPRSRRRSHRRCRHRSRGVLASASRETADTEPAVPLLRASAPHVSVPRPSRPVLVPAPQPPVDQEELAELAARDADAASQERAPGRALSNKSLRANRDREAPAGP